MKHLILSFVFLFSFVASASVSIVSDLDDTIKITNAGNARYAVYNGVFTEKVFTGMPEFLEEARSYSTSLHVISASPPIIAPRVRATLQSNGIKYDSILLKKVLSRESKIAYKVKAIKKIIDETNDDVILMGDDVNHDPEAYLEVQAAYPDKVLAVYIHVINGREIPGSPMKYWTSFDLALREFIAGRMTVSGVEKVTTAMLSEKKLSRMLPKFANCPSAASVFEWQLQTVFVKDAQELTDKITAHCQLKDPKKT